LISAWSIHPCTSVEALAVVCQGAKRDSSEEASRSVDRSSHGRDCHRRRGGIRGGLLKHGEVGPRCGWDDIRDGSTEEVRPRQVGQPLAVASRTRGIASVRGRASWNQGGLDASSLIPSGDMGVEVGWGLGDSCPRAREPPARKWANPAQGSIRVRARFFMALAPSHGAQRSNPPSPAKGRLHDRK